MNSFHTNYTAYSKIGYLNRAKKLRHSGVTMATSDRGNRGSKSNHGNICNFVNKVTTVTITSVFTLVAMETMALK